MIGPDFGYDDLCSCDADTPEVRACILRDPPCCDTCPHCSHQIRSEVFDAHVAKHRQRADELELQVRVLFSATPLE